MLERPSYAVMGGDGSAEFVSFLKMSNLTIENLFQKTLAAVKAAVETVSESSALKVWSQHLYEQGSHVVLLFAGPQKPFSTSNSINLWGNFPKKRLFDQQRKKIRAVSS